MTIEAFIGAYATVGYSQCANGAVEAGIEKVALFAIQTGNGLIPTHAARQLETGEWTSKLGRFEDICHPMLEAVNGPTYGQPICYLSRPRPAQQ